MKRQFPATAIVLLIAALWSFALIVASFVVDIPVRAGAHNLVRTAAGENTEVPIHPQTYFQKYGVTELVLVGLGIVLTLVVAGALRRRAAESAAGAGAVAWGTAGTSLLLGIVGFVTIAPYLLVVGVLVVIACRAFSGSAVTVRGTEAGAKPVTLSAPH